LILRTWKGWTRTRKWNESFPAVLTMYLLAQIRAAGGDEGWDVEVSDVYKEKVGFAV